MSRRTFRLSTETYSVPGVAWLVTLGTKDRASKPFSDADLAGAVLAGLVEDASFYDVVLHLAVLMPDHAHLVVETGNSNLIDVMRNLKSRSTHVAWRQGHVGPLWQRSFHDRALRGRSEFGEVVSYVLQNPVRAGLVANWEAYPFVAGSLIYSDDERRDLPSEINASSVVAHGPRTVGSPKARGR